MSAAGGSEARQSEGGRGRASVLPDGLLAPLTRANSEAVKTRRPRKGVSATEAEDAPDDARNPRERKLVYNEIRGIVAAGPVGRRSGDNPLASPTNDWRRRILPRD